MDQAGEPNMRTLHQGMPLAHRVKHMQRKWYGKGLEPFKA